MRPSPCPRHALTLTACLLGLWLGACDSAPARPPEPDAPAGDTDGGAPGVDAGSASDAGPPPQTGLGDPDQGALAYAAQCAGCHGASGEGGLGKALAGWARADAELVSIIDARMPPADPAACRGECARDIAAYVLRGFQACGATQYAPRQLRLLTRREYNNTVKALLAPPVQACTGDGDCDVASESCVGGACQKDPCNVRTFLFPANGRRYTSVHAAGSFNGWAPTVAAGGWALGYVAARDAYVTKRVLANGTHRYKFVADGTWLSDPGNASGEDDGYGGRNSVLSLDCAPPGPRDALGVAAGFPVESRPRGYGYDNHAASGLVTPVHVEQYLQAAQTLSREALTRLPSLLPCNPSTVGARACAEQFVRAFGTRAFRRPLTEAEVTRYVGRITAQPTFEAGIGVALRALLSSPYFLYRFELGEPQPDGTYRLTGHEKATALSYLFWGTSPDAALLDAAAGGALDTAEGVEAQARRLLADARSREVVGTFALQWLGVERVLTVDKSPVLFPGFTPELRQALAEETRRFVTHVVFDSTHRFDELFTADYTFANEALAAHYGLAGVTGTQPRRVASPAQRNAGLLGHGSVLASHAHSDQTSPIRRGLFVREHLLCQDLGTPPPNAGGVPDVDPNATTRERFRQHSDNAACRSCHQYIDGVGFGLERFDAVGRYRQTENGLPIDASGDLNDVERLGSGTRAPYGSLAELSGLLVGSDRARECFALQYHRFASGRLETPDDRCALNAVERRFADSGYDVRELMMALTRSPTFSLRK